MSNTRWDWIRFPREKALEHEILSDPLMKHLMKRSTPSASSAAELDPIWKVALPFRPSLHGPLALALQQTQISLGYNGGSQIFIVADDAINAAFMGVRGVEKIPAFYFTSGALEKLSPKSLLAIVAHEFGHYLFHSDSPPILRLAAQHHDELSPLLRMRLAAWSRAKEITADRVSYVVCGAFDPVAHALFRSSFGLELQRDSHIHDYLAEVEPQISRSNPGDFPDDYFESHPFSPSRLLALRSFSRACVDPAVPSDLTAANADAAKVLSYFENPILSNPLAVPDDLRSCLLTLACELTLVDGEISEAEVKKMEETLQIPNARAQISVLQGRDPAFSIAEIEKQASRSILHLDGKQRFDLLSALVAISAADGYIPASELDILRYAAESFGMNPSIIDKCVQSLGLPKLQQGPDRQIPARAIRLKISIWEAMVRRDPTSPSPYVHWALDLQAFAELESQNAGGRSSTATALLDTLRAAVLDLRDVTQHPLCDEILAFSSLTAHDHENFMPIYRERLVGRPPQVSAFKLHERAGAHFLTRREYRESVNAFLTALIHDGGIDSAFSDRFEEAVYRLLDTTGPEGLIMEPGEFLGLARKVAPEHPCWKALAANQPAVPSPASDSAYIFNQDNMQAVVAQYQTYVTHIQATLPQDQQLAQIQAAAEAYQRAVLRLMGKTA